MIAYLWLAGAVARVAAGWHTGELTDHQAAGVALFLALVATSNTTLIAGGAVALVAARQSGALDIDPADLAGPGFLIPALLGAGFIAVVGDKAPGAIAWVGSAAALWSVVDAARLFGVIG